jgi:hypothetical protein
MYLLVQKYVSLEIFPELFDAQIFVYHGTQIDAMVVKDWAMRGQLLGLLGNQTTNNE